MGYRNLRIQGFQLPNCVSANVQCPSVACLHWVLLAYLGFTKLFHSFKVGRRGKYLAQIALYNNYLNARKKPFNYHVRIPKCFNINLLISFKHSFETII